MATPAVTRRQALAWRMRRQHLLAGAADSPEVVRTLGAVSIFGSDPDLAFRQLILEAGSDIAILEPGLRMARLPEASQAYAAGMTQWLVDHWLDGTNNWHQRWRGSLRAGFWCSMTFRIRITRTSAGCGCG